jgi:uncharacterized membrane protein HdeD (DUF308 family)
VSANNQNETLTAGFFGVTGDSARSQMLAQNWWVIALRGVLALIFGVIAILLPGATIAGLVLVFAAYMLVDGVFAIISGARAARRHERWGLLIFEGIIDLLAAGIALAWPLITVISIIYLIGAWAIVSGAMMFAAAFRLRLEHGRWWLAFSGLVSVIWGFLLLVWPIVGAIVLAWWMGVYALVFGVSLLVLAFKLRRERDRLTPSAGAMSPA